MRIALDIEKENIERAVKGRIISTHALPSVTDCEDSGYKRLADLFRGC